MRRRQQPSATGEAAARAVDVVALTLRAFRRPLQTVRAVLHVNRHETLLLLRRNEEEGVLHSQRIGDARANELIERHSRSALDDAAEDIDAVAVNPLLAGLRDERK